MAGGLKGATYSLPTMRDLPDADISPVDKLAESLEENRGMLGKIFGSGINPSRSQQEMMEAERMGKMIEAYGAKPESIERLAMRNPDAAHYLYSAYQNHLAIKKEQAGLQQVTSPYLKPAGAGEMGEAIPPQADIQGAIKALIAQNTPASLARAKELSQFTDKLKGSRDSGLTSTEVGAAFADPTAYDPLNLVASRGVQGAKDAYRKQYDNIRKLEELTITDPFGRQRRQFLPSSQAREIGSVDLGADFRKQFEQARELNAKHSGLEGYMDVVSQGIEKYGDKIPGVGYAKNYGASNLFKSKEGQDIFNAFKGVESEVAKAGAGLSQTQIELERIQQKLASNGYNSPREFVTQFKLLQRIYEAEKKVNFGMLPQEVRDYYKDVTGNDPTTVPWRRRGGADSGQDTKFTPKQQKLKDLLGGK